MLNLMNIWISITFIYSLKAIYKFKSMSGSWLPTTTFGTKQASYLNSIKWLKKKYY